MLPVGVAKGSQVRLGPRRRRHQIWVRNLVSAQGLREKQRVRVSSPQIKTVPGDIGELLDKQKKAHCPMTGTHCHCLTAGKAHCHCLTTGKTLLLLRKSCHCPTAGENNTLSQLPDSRRKIHTVTARGRGSLTCCHCPTAGELAHCHCPTAGGNNTLSLPDGRRKEHTVTARRRENITQCHCLIAGENNTVTA